MQDYVSLKADHMAFLIRALDGNPDGVTAPALAPLSTVRDESLVREEIAFLRRTSLPIEPRKKWPAGGMPRYNVKVDIPAPFRAQPGKALCMWGDAGWGVSGQGEAGGRGGESGGGTRGTRPRPRVRTGGRALLVTRLAPGS